MGQLKKHIKLGWFGPRHLLDMVYHFLFLVHFLPKKWETPSIWQWLIHLPRNMDVGEHFKLYQVCIIRKLLRDMILPCILKAKTLFSTLEFFFMSETSDENTMGQKIKQSLGQKNSWNQIQNQFDEKNFLDQNPFFVISKMAKNLFLNWQKV